MPLPCIPVAGIVTSGVDCPKPASGGAGGGDDEDDIVNVCYCRGSNVDLTMTIDTKYTMGITETIISRAKIQRVCLVRCCDHRDRDGGSTFGHAF